MLDILHNDVVTVTSNVDQHCSFPAVVTWVILSGRIMLDLTKI